MTDYQYNHLVNVTITYFGVTNALVVFVGCWIVSRLDELVSKKNKKSS